MSRYVHLNPVRAGLVARPEDSAWSSYAGYADRKRRLPWVAYDALLTAWGGEFGRKDPARAYRKFVGAGVSDPPPSPFRDAFGGWALGSDGFVSRLRSLAGPLAADPPVPDARRLAGLDPAAVCRAVAEHYGLDPSSLSLRGDAHIARAVASLCRLHTEAPLRELAPCLGLSRADSVPNLTRRYELRPRASPRLVKDVKAITQRLLEETKSQG